jgi:hypothetical protein
MRALRYFCIFDVFGQREVSVLTLIAIIDILSGLVPFSSGKGPLAFGPFFLLSLIFYLFQKKKEKFFVL